MELTEALESAFDTAQPEAATTVETPEAPAVESTAESRARDEAGRFAKNTPVEPEVQAPVIDTPVVPTAKAAPSSWRKEVAEKHWGKFDPEAQEEILRREGDFHKGIESWRSNADKGRAYEQALAPFQETLKALNVDGVTAVTELMKADHVLRHAPESVKVQKILELANVYGIDLQKQFSPDVTQYEQKLFQQEQQLKDLMGQREAESKQALNSDIEAFKAEPGHEHFEAVRAHMASLLQGGQAKDLRDAYEQAVYANPTTRNAVLEQQRQAQRAKAAAVSVRGSSPASGASNVVDKASIKDAVSAAFDQHST